MMKRCSICAWRRSYNDSQQLPSRSQASLPTSAIGDRRQAKLGMPIGIKKRIAKRSAKRPVANAAIKKKPSASQSGHPGDAEGWGDFQLVPFAKPSKNKAGQPFSHLKLHGDLKRAPAVVKYIQNGDLHTSGGLQSIKDFLRSLDKKGDGSWLQEWEQAAHSDRKAIIERLKLQLDEKSVLTIKQSTKTGTRTEGGEVRGWMALWEVADVEKIPFDPKYSALLKDCVELDESKPHDNPTLARKGWRMYYHVKKKATTETTYHDDNHEATAIAEPDDHDDFEAARGAIRQAGLGRIAGHASSSSSFPLEDGSKTAACKWKSEADEVIKALSDAENAASSLQGEITTAIENNSNPALQKKHANVAASWVKKLNLKKGFVMKNKTLATNCRSEIFDKEGNKFDECLKVSKALLEEWEDESNMGLLKKLLEF